MYREGVIRSLNKLAVSGSKTVLYQDSDIFSTCPRDRVQLWLEATNEDDDTRGLDARESIAIQDGLRCFDTRSGVIRDIRYIQSKFLGLYLTRDNLHTFFNSANTELESKKLACTLLTHLVEGWWVTGETLDALEFNWTGKDRGQDQPFQDATFLVVAGVAAYLSPDWQQTREFSYVAVEEHAVHDLLKQAGRKLADGYNVSDLPFVGRDDFSHILLVLHRQSAGSNLLACISRVCLSTGIVSTEESAHQDALSVVSPERSNHKFIFRADTVLKIDTASRRTFVRALYDQYKLGRNEPFVPFLRCSAFLDELGIPENSALFCPQSRWFNKPPDLPRMPDHGVLIATSTNPAVGSMGSRLCLFVTDPDIVAICQEQILHQLTTFKRDLEALQAHSTTGSQKSRKCAVIEENGAAWAPRKPNTMWDVLIDSECVLEDAFDKRDAARVRHNQMTAAHDNPRTIRKVNREDTPRPSPNPQFTWNFEQHRNHERFCKAFESFQRRLFPTQDSTQPERNLVLSERDKKSPELVDASQEQDFADYNQTRNGESSRRIAVDGDLSPSLLAPFRRNSVECLETRPVKRPRFTISEEEAQDTDSVGLDSQPEPESDQGHNPAPSLVFSPLQDLLSWNGPYIDDETFATMLANGHFSST
ncbi:hypothetical protein VTI28DRAFT_4482 [Corynascus sepedonium]